MEVSFGLGVLLIMGLGLGGLILLGVGLYVWQQYDDPKRRAPRIRAGIAVGLGIAMVPASLFVVGIIRERVESVVIDPGEVTITVGETTQLSATLYGLPKSERKDGTLGTNLVTVILTGRGVTWSTADDSIATVSSDGLVTAVGAGQVTVRAKSEGVAGRSTIAVVRRTGDGGRP